MWLGCTDAAHHGFDIHNNLASLFITYFFLVTHSDDYKMLHISRTLWTLRSPLRHLHMYSCVQPTYTIAWFLSPEGHPPRTSSPCRHMTPSLSAGLLLSQVGTHRKLLPPILLSATVFHLDMHGTEAFYSSTELTGSFIYRQWKVAHS